MRVRVGGGVLGVGFALVLACSEPGALGDAPDGATSRVDAQVREDAGSRDGATRDAEPASDGGGLDGGAPPSCTREVEVDDQASLDDAIAALAPGDCVVIADGEYQMPTLSARGTEAAPIVVRAENRGAVEITRGDLRFEDASYLTVEGLDFTSSGHIELVDSDHCRLTRARVHRTEMGEADWIVLNGTSHHNRIDHNDVGPQRVLGNMVMFAGRGDQVVQHNQVDHNLFHDITNTGGNGWEAIRLGLSGLSLSSGHNVVEYNLFRGATGDPETISVKTGENVIRYNTFRATEGEITLRHGDGNLVYGNFILADGLASARGIRVCDSDHRVFNNYLEGITASPAILLRAGNADDGDPLTGHFRVYRTEVVHNTIVASRGIVIGGSDPLAPVDCVIANNLVVGGTTGLVTESSGEGTRYLGNIVHATGSGTPGVSRPAAEIRNVDPRLERVGEVMRPSSESPAIDAAGGAFEYVALDIDEEPREGRSDVGADERSASPRGRPLTEADVGPDAP